MWFDSVATVGTWAWKWRTGLRPFTGGPWPGALAPVLRAPNQLATTLPAVRYPDVHYVYVLRSSRDGNLYTGYTADLRKRLADHAAGKALSTRNRRPLQLIYYEAYLLPKDAKAREVRRRPLSLWALYKQQCGIRSAG